MNRSDTAILIPLLLLVMILGSPGPAEADSSPVAAEFLSPDATYPVSVDYFTDTVLILERSWRFQLGDNPNWADPAFDDSHWPVLSSMLRTDTLGRSDWPGIGWFRVVLKVDSSLFGAAVTVQTQVAGALELYLNGRQIASYGTVSEDPDRAENILNQGGTLSAVVLDSIPRQVIAVRYSTAGLPDWPFDSEVGFRLGISEAPVLYRFLTDQTSSFTGRSMFAFGMAIALFLIHILMFAFYPSRRENLYHALFALSFAGLNDIPLHILSATNLSTAVSLGILFNILVVLCGVSGPLVLYRLFYDRMPKTIWPIIGLGTILAALAWTLPVQVIYVFGLLSLAEGGRVVIVANVRRKPLAWVIGIGFIIFIAATALEIAPSLGLISRAVLPEGLFSLGAISMMVSMSVYIASIYARTARDLSRRLEEVRTLSEKAIEQERVAKEREMRQKLLEADLAHKAKELEEARKLEQALRELERTNNDLQQTQAQLVQSEKMASLGQLVAGVAHEINTPIGAVNSMHNTLLKAIEKLKKQIAGGHEPDRAEIEKYFKIIEDANGVISSGTDRVKKIVRRLRSFARLDEAELKTVDIHEGLEDTLSLLQHEMKHGIEVEKNYGDIPPIACYPGQLNQVFLNLLVNAMQAMGGEGTIRISTGVKDNQAFISIADTGAGIPQRHLDRVFDPGFTTKGVGVGTGLGLSICYQIVKAHHGRITVESAEGEGTTFTVYLPLNLGAIMGETSNKPNNGN